MKDKELLLRKTFLQDKPIVDFALIEGIKTNSRQHSSGMARYLLESRID